MMEYQRLTDKDWHKEKFYPKSENERVIRKRLWDLENKIEQETLKEIPENAIVLTSENEIKQYEWSKMLDKMGFFKFANNTRKETAKEIISLLEDMDKRGMTVPFNMVLRKLKECYNTEVE